MQKVSRKIIELIIQRYPSKKREYEEYLSDIMSTYASDDRKRENEERDKPQSVTEAKAIKLSNVYADRLEKEIAAVEEAYDNLNDEEKKVIRERYWVDAKKTPYHKIKQAYYSERQMIRIVNKVIYRVGKYIGEINQYDM